jgi:divalent metal cation (Fe/Co/Zn/Cd) transporter
MKKIEKSKVLADIVAKQSDIIYKKVFVFVAVSGGSWIYGIKIDGYFGFVVWIVFVLSVIGIVFNLTKMGILYKELEDIKNG